MGRVDHPFISESVFHCPNSAIANVFGKVPNIRENLRFRDLRKTGTWINSKISISVGNWHGADRTSDHSSVKGAGRARVEGNKNKQVIGAVTEGGVGFTIRVVLADSEPWDKEK
jgi:hypothetical protein